MIPDDRTEFSEVLINEAEFQLKVKKKKKNTRGDIIISVPNICHIFGRVQLEATSLSQLPSTLNHKQKKKEDTQSDAEEKKDFRRIARPCVISAV